MRLPLFPRWLGRRLLGAVLLLWSAGWATAADETVATGAERETSPPVSSLEVGHPFLRNYTPREYQGFHTTHALLQGNDGVMFVGTHGCLLEFDGVTWRRIPVGLPALSVRGLALQPGTGTIFVGGTNELGYLKTLPGGEHAFVSLLDQLPAEARSFKETTHAYAMGDAVYFVAEQQVMRWQNGRFKVWSLSGKFALGSACIAGRLYVLNGGNGVSRLEDDDTFTPCSPDPTLAQSDLRFVEPNPDGSFLVGSFNHGLFTLRDGAVTPLASPANDLLKTASIRTARRLRDGSLVVGTMTSGIIVLDPALHFRDRWDTAAGLQNEVLWEALEDQEGGVWLSLDVGVSRVEPSPVLSVFDEGNGFKRQIVWDVRRMREDLHLATEKGVVRLRPADPATGVTARCEQIFASAICENLCQVDQGILACGMGVTWLGDDGRTTQVRPANVTTDVLLRSQAHPDRLFTGTKYRGLNSLRWSAADQSWAEEGDIPEISDRVENLVEDREGGLWAGAFNHGLFHVRFSEEGGGGRRVAAVTSYFQQPGPLAGQNQVAVRLGAGQEILAAAKDRIYRFDPRSANFVPADYAGFPAAGSTEVGEYFPSDDGKGLWLVGLSSDPTLTVQPAGWAPRIGPGEGKTFRPLPAKVTERIGRVTEIFPDRDGIAWVTGTEGLVRLDSRLWLQAPAPAPARTLLRQAFSTAGQNREDQPQSIPDGALPYQRNSVHFDYAATTFEAGPRPSYQVRLAGIGASQWSSFHERPSADYTNLPEGNYTFEVRARDADGRPGSLASLTFRILPPWQRSPWAYVFYPLASAAAVYALVRWRNRQLRRRNAALEATVAVRTGELRARETELVRARDAAESANRAKSVFLASMSHELRTPLNAILGYSQILLGNNALSARSREQIAVIDQSGEHLLTLINEVLDIAKVEAGKLTLNASDFPLAPLLDEIGAAFRPRLVEKGLTFHDVRLPGLQAFVHTDRDRLRQVLFNLLSNAVKFARQGSVRLEVGPGEPADAPTLRFAVEDTGIGIAEGELANIFEAFHQVSDRPATVQGTGLGLAISQQLVNLLGGVLRVESEPARGSRFWFDLPLAPAASSSSADFSSSPSSVPSAPEPPRGAPPTITGYLGTTRRLLIVDDQTENRRVLRDLLVPLGFAVDEAADGAACLEQCARELPDAVLLDLRMGPPDGFEVARTLGRRADTGEPFAIVALSASVFETDRQRALDAGCDDFLPKPFRTRQVLDVLGRLLALRWTYAEATPPTPPEPLGHAEDGGKLSAPELDRLRELSGRGDVMGIRKQLEAWQADPTRPGRAALVRELLPLAITYQVDALHARLLELSPAP